MQRGGGGGGGGGGFYGASPDTQMRQPRARTEGERRGGSRVSRMVVRGGGVQQESMGEGLARAKSALMREAEADQVREEQQQCTGKRGGGPAR